jgi:hypothetical protein
VVLRLQAGQEQSLWDEARLKGHDGMRTSTGWAILAYDLDTPATRTR